MAGFNFMQRFYYGKAGKADYTPDQLPTSRVQLFFEMLRIHFWGVVQMNLLYVLFSLPAIVWTAINVAVLIGGEGTMDMAANTGILLTYLVGMIPCQMLSGVGATGEMYVLRNWARDQHAFAFSDFKDAVKENWKYGLLTGFINGLSLLVMMVCYVFYGQMSEQSVLYVVPQMLVVVITAIWWMMNMLIFPMMVTYDSKYKDLLRNSALMAVGRLPWSVLMLVGTAVVPAVIVLFVPYGAVVMTLVYLVIGFGLTGLIYASYAISCFDKYLNPRIPGAQVNMGLRAASEEDEEDVEDPNPLI